ncbi:hypothetical protein Lalb_Chr18g0051181 [Lupinus albus]|uniref:Uncharacterized protein n=1 Tax=Lupinus albus TaxID=3870 RepID=A0A6A4NYD8_LUPAL|nr:hypothetical protein Lalb_Chr18g0051181 [Lupinus albus]
MEATHLVLSLRCYMRVVFLSWEKQTNTQFVCFTRICFFMSNFVIIQSIFDCNHSN